MNVTSPPDAARVQGSAMETVRLLAGILRHLSSGEPAPARVVEEIVRTASEHLGFERTALFAVDHDGFVRGLVGYGVSSEQIRAVAEAITAVPLVEQAIACGHTVHSEDVPAEGAIPEHLIEVFGVASLVVAPLYADQRLLGILCADRGAGIRFPLGEDERVIVDAFASQVALALRIAQLVAEGTDAARQNERLRIAGRLHDSVAQLFYVIGAECARARTGASTELAPVISHIEQLAARGGREVRRAIDSMGAVAGSADAEPHRLGVVLGTLRELYACELTLVGDWPRLALDAPVWDVVLGAVREGVANAVKHGGAHHVVLWVQLTHDYVVLEVRDDGHSPETIGEDAPAAGGGFGLNALRRRLCAVDGSLTLLRNDDGGHTLRVRLRAAGGSRTESHLADSAPDHRESAGAPG